MAKKQTPEQQITQLRKGKLFKKHADKLRLRATQLDSFILPVVEAFELDWKLINTVALSTKKNKWQQLPIYKKLLDHKESPAVYYFLIMSGDLKLIYNLYKESKAFHLEVSKSKGLRNEQFRNISHVPNIFSETDCLYVGSRKCNVHQRLIQHLGFGAKRTGALNLVNVLAKKQSKFRIMFYCHILNENNKDITTHIESAIQNHLRPLIGKNVLGD